MSARIPLLKDRREAGRLLAAALQRFHGHPRAIVLALPRGGVEVGFMVSMHLQIPLEVFLTRKLGFPGNPEYAMGAITETGLTWLNTDVQELNLQRDARFQKYLHEEIVRQQQEIHRQQQLYRQGHPLRLLKGYTVILVDDGIATGSTFLASIHSLRALGIARLAGGIPLGPAATIQQIRTLVDDLEVLVTPDPFSAVGVHYQHFPQVEDEQVLQYLKSARQQFPDSAQPSAYKS